MQIQPLQKRTTFVRNGKTIVMEDGVLDSEIPIGDGTSRFFHPNGTVSEEVPVVAGETHGIVRSWHDNGVLAQEKTYVHGKLHGLIRDWDKDGSLLHEIDYILPNAVYHTTYADVGRVHHAFLWNGKPLSKARWTKKVEAAGISEPELDRRLSTSGTPQEQGRITLNQIPGDGALKAFES
jgi:antitoxin component YwqK of YwqJK toxin-antitoxin module